MNKGDLLQLDIADLDENGCGVAYSGGKLVCVCGALQGESVIAKIAGFSDGSARAELVKIVKFSPNRVEPKCPYTSACGGCSLQRLKYDKQLEFKTELLKNELQKANIQCEPQKTIGIYYPYAYRNKIHFAVGGRNGKVALGFFKEGTKDIIDIPKCALHESWAEKLYSISKKFITESRIATYDIDSGRGNLRYITARCLDNKNIQVTLVGTEKFMPSAEYFYKALKEQFDSVSLYYNQNTTADSAVYSDKFTHLFGEKKLKCTVMGVDIELLPSAFMQVNAQIMQKIYKKVAELSDAAQNKTVIDLFSGIGITSLFFARAGADVISVEIEKAAVDEAKRLAKINSLSDMINALCGDCAEVFPIILSSLSNCDTTVFVDPPRRGLGSAVSSLLAKSGTSKIIYLSCSPSSLASDLIILSQNYSVSSIQPYDMFPQTLHLETLVCLEKTNQNCDMVCKRE